MSFLKKYYRITFTLASPLSIGCGEDRLTDSDIVRDSRGLPYIPGTSLAGVYRNLFSGDEADKYFGRRLTEERIQEAENSGENLLTESSVLVYDAQIAGPDKIITSTRDMVALDEYKTSIPGAKFDFEILEPGVTFVTYIEQNMQSADQQIISDEIAQAWLAGEIKLGAKTERGYGHTRCLKAESCTFDLSKEEDMHRWLDFDMYGTDSGDVWTETAALPRAMREDTVTVRLQLRLPGGISVRRYSTDVGEADYMQITENPRSDIDEKSGEEGTPVIPGTSWAGAFRAQMEKLDGSFAREGRLAEIFFGKVKNNVKDSRRSRIGFSESRLSGGRWVTYTRNAIDRFSGGAADGALYTEKTYYNGETSLEITCDMHGMETDDRKRFARAFSAAVMDLGSGFMAVGGLTAVGRGIFEIEKAAINGTEYRFDQYGTEEMYGLLCRAVAGEGE